MDQRTLPLRCLLTVVATLTFLFAANQLAYGEEEGAAAPSAGASSGGSDSFVTEKRDGKTFKYKKKTSYDFEGASIDGVYNKPAGSYISNIKDVKARSIIKVRENFDAEVSDSARQVR